MINKLSWKNTMMAVENQNTDIYLYKGFNMALGELFKDKLMFGYIPYYEYTDIETLYNNKFKSEIYKLAKEYAFKKI